MTRTITPKQREILDAIVRLKRDHDFSPSVRELGVAVGLRSSSTVKAHLESLERLGFIKRNPKSPRTVVVLRPAE